MFLFVRCFHLLICSTPFGKDVGAPNDFNPPSRRGCGRFVERLQLFFFECVWTFGFCFACLFDVFDWKFLVLNWVGL